MVSALSSLRHIGDQHLSRRRTSAFRHANRRYGIMAWHHQRIISAAKCGCGAPWPCISRDCRGTWRPTTDVSAASRWRLCVLATCWHQCSATFIDEHRAITLHHQKWRWHAVILKACDAAIAAFLSHEHLAALAPVTVEEALQPISS